MRNYLYPVVLAVAFVGIWEVSIAALDVPTYVLPSWIEIATSVWSDRSLILSHFIITGIEAAAGGLLAVVSGTTLAIACAEVKIVRQAAFPYVVAMNAVPVVAVAPLVVLWFGNGYSSKVIISAFVAFFPVFIAAFQGLSGSRERLRELFIVFNVPRGRQFLWSDLPSAASYVVAGIKTTLTLSVIGAVVGEFVGSDRGLGYGMLQARFSLDTPRVFAYLLASMALGLAMYGLGLLIERVLAGTGRFEDMRKV